MPLETYKKKRDFTKTPEPAGGQPGDGTGRFVVQRHRATARHYDFRMEIGGVLVSWAVPKGPTLDPGERRMAIHVEDHPIEYFDFEGIIPRGEYGAGDVIVWDWGMFEPEETDDPQKALRKGELKFRLDGQKLHGRFTIVRTEGFGRDRDDKEKWLLIKKHDETAVAGWDAEDHPRSVKSGRTNDEVKANAPAVWSSQAPAAEAEIDLSAARAEPMPDFVPPMRATLGDAPFTDDDWLFEIKWDGYRVEAVVRDKRVKLWTRNRNDAAPYFPDLVGPPDWIDAREAIVDGEVVAFDGKGNPSFSLLQDRTGIRGISGGADGRRPRSPSERKNPQEVAAIPIAFEAFDLLYLDGRSLLDVPLEHRKRLLRKVLRPHPLVRYASHVDTDGETFYEVARERHLEGIVAKQRHSRYEPDRRSKTWLKIKLRQEQELVVAGWLPGKGTHKDLGSLIVGVYDDGKLRHAGQVGSGLDTRMRRDLLERFAQMRRDTSPLDPMPRIKDAHWIEPEIVIRAEFTEWTDDDLLRQAAFKGIEIGKDPREVVRERPIDADRAAASIDRASEKQRSSANDQKQTADKRTARRSTRRTSAKVATTATTDPGDAPTAEELAALDAMQKDGFWQVARDEVKLTNLDKVLFPAEGGHPALTKRDVFRYYARIAPILLPYLRDRAVNRNRYPNGIHAASFWQKDVPGHAPKWLKRWTYTGHEGTKDYAVADRAAALVWMAQEAALELHPWTSPTDAPHTPSYALIDIDPGTQTTWEEVLVLARLYRAALRHLDVIGLPKVTGKRGIQVWVPVKPIYSFEDTRRWVEGISRAIGQTVPDLVSWQWTKRDRGGKARLDYTQNAVNKTLVGPYVVRPAPGAPVSAPISWDELDDPDLRPNRWTISTIWDRLDSVGDLFAPALERDQELPSL